MKALFQALLDAIKNFFTKIYNRVIGKVDSTVKDVTDKINDSNP